MSSSKFLFFASLFYISLNFFGVHNLEREDQLCQKYGYMPSNYFPYTNKLNNTFVCLNYLLELYSYAIFKLVIYISSMFPFLDFVNKIPVYSVDRSTGLQMGLCYFQYVDDLTLITFIVTILVFLALRYTPFFKGSEKSKDKKMNYQRKKVD